MLRKLSLLFVKIFWSINFSQPVINEFLASNVTNYPEMYDFDDYTDWIEIYNPDNVPHTLDGYFISDDFGDPLKWKIPDDIFIEAGGFLIIWADDYNDIPGKLYRRPYWPWNEFITQHYHTNFKLSKSGEVLGLYKANQGEETLLIEEGAIWKYLDNGTDQGSNWKELNYNDDSWNSGYAELGYGDGDESTVIEYGEDSDNKYITTYFRRQFNVENAEDFQNLTLSLKRDDGAVVYLNGIEIIRNNMPSGTIYYDTFANISASADTENLFYNWFVPGILLQDGQNIIGVEIHQVSRSSSDVSFNLELRGSSYSDIILIDSVSFNNQLTDVSYGRMLDDNNQWSYFGEPTIGEPNTTPTASTLHFSGLIESSIPSGFYNGSQIVTLYSTNSEGQIHYTLDGSKPSSNTSLYTEPIIIESSLVLKARLLETGKLPGEVLTASYFINEPNNISTVSLIAEPNTLWDDDIGIYENEFKQREIPVTIQYYDSESQHVFSIDAGSRIGGLNIWTKPQKPFTIYTRGRFGDDFIRYKLFDNKQIVNFSRIVFRNGGDDWEETLIRDPMTESIVMGYMHCGYMAYKPTALYLNGSYWGIHNIREKFDRNYFFENFNINPDNIDHLEYTLTSSGTQMQVIEGTIDRYQLLIDYILNNDINNISIYKELKDYMNIDSFIDHIVMTLFCANTSWEHNREWWRSREEGGKWNWLIVDLDRGFDLNNISRNLLDNLLEDYELFKYLMASQYFKDRFIQRAAGHLNNTFNFNRINDIVDSLSNAIASEIPRHINKWGNDGGILSESNWENELGKIKQFAESRNDIVLEQFINELNLDGTVQITLNTIPPNAGIILINDVPVINTGMTGSYFKNTSANIVANAYPGYTFIGWEEGPDTNNISYNFNVDSSFTAIFSPSGEIILPNVISDNITLTNNQPYVINQNLIIPAGLSLTMNEGVEIRVIEGKNIVVNGKLVINGTLGNKVNIISHSSIGENRWGSICFNNSLDTSIISHLNISGASSGIDPLIHHGAISSINSHIIIDHLKIENVIFPVFVQGGSVHMKNSLISCDFVCDFINVKGGNAIIEDNIFYGSDAQDTDAIDLDNVVNGIVRNNRIYNFNGYNSDGIDIGENSENIFIDSNLIYHAQDKGISVGQSSSTIINKNLILGSNHGVAIKDNSESVIINNTFYKNDTSVSSFEKNEGAGGGSVEIINSILSNSLSLPIYKDEVSSLSIKYSLSDSELLDGEGNLFTDPLFIDPQIYNLELEENSPCLNSGDPYYQLDEDGSVSDIGAYYTYNVNDYPFEFSSSLHQLLINELLAVNDYTNSDENGENDDWIELFNPTGEPINLSGLYLTDDLDNLTKWQFSGMNLSIDPESYILLWCDNDVSQGLLHTNFKLSSSGETIALVHSDGLTIIDSVSFGVQTSDQSYGRINYESNQWAFLTPTPGYSNLILSSPNDGYYPDVFQLLQNYPNPFNPATTIQYSLPVKAFVKITIFNILGKKIKTLVNTNQEAGYKYVRWNGTNIRNEKVSAGLYLYSIQAGNYTKTRKMILLK